MKEAVSIFISNEARTEVLLIKRRDIPVWVFPGGGIEQKESPESAAQREVLEETGCSISIKRKITKYLPVNRLSQPTHFFEGTVVSGKPITGPETKEIQFFPLNSLPRLLAPPYQEWIDDALRIQLPTEKNIEGVTYSRMIKLLMMHPLLVSRFLLTKCGIHINNY